MSVRRAFPLIRLHFIAVFAICLVPLACGDGDGDSTGPGGLDPKAFVGTWTLSMDAAQGCWLAGTLSFVVEDDDTNVLPNTGGTMNVISQWDFGLMTGNLKLELQTFELNLWKQPPPQSIGGKFIGSIESESRLTGTFIDMGGAFSDPSKNCSAPAIATK